jgi:phosphatidylinositol glycan class M
MKPETSKGKTDVEEEWTINRLLIVSFLIRILLIFYANIHDYIFKVKFTDIDYTVYSDAAYHVYNGRSPYARATYRYSPILAFALLPNVIYADFGKVLFSLIDILTGWLIYLNGAESIKNSDLFGQFKTGLCVFWLFNPFIAIISSRGNADTVVCSCIALVIYLIRKNQVI